MESWGTPALTVPLKVVSDTFSIVCFLSLKESTCHLTAGTDKTHKNDLSGNHLNNTVGHTLDDWNKNIRKTVNVFQ